SFGQRAVSFNGDGDVQIPYNPAFELSSGAGTIEAVIYEDPAAAYVASDHTILAEANDGDPAGANFYLRASANGSFLKYGNSGGGSALSWLAPASLLGQFAHVAVVIDHDTNVTAYINGINLGTKTQNPSAGLSGQFWIGSMGTSSGDNWWYGSVDEVAFYSAALSHQQPADRGDHHRTPGRLSLQDHARRSDRALAPRRNQRHRGG
ncbi:MAG: LamG domain-containing protein, partial [Verrucomicrobia bacterium]|nr:LamG domain-containing protein [Verrucomicrobiota bacterium]